MSSADTEPVQTPEATTAESVAPAPAPEKKRRGRPPAQKPSAQEAFSTALARGPTGRDSGGQFALGNKGGPGNSIVQAQYRRLKEALMKSVTASDIKEVMEVIISRAKAGEIEFCRLFLDYTVGKATPPPPPPPDESVIRNAIAVQVNVPYDLKGMSSEQINRVRELDSLLAADKGEVQEVAYTISSASAAPSAPAPAQEQGAQDV